MNDPSLIESPCDLPMQYNIPNEQVFWRWEMSSEHLFAKINLANLVIWQLAKIYAKLKRRLSPRVCYFGLGKMRKEGPQGIVASLFHVPSWPASRRRHRGLFHSASRPVSRLFHAPSRPSSCRRRRRRFRFVLSWRGLPATGDIHLWNPCNRWLLNLHRNRVSTWSPASSQPSYFVVWSRGKI